MVCGAWYRWVQKEGDQFVALLLHLRLGQPEDAGHWAL